MEIDDEERRTEVESSIESGEEISDVEVAADLIEETAETLLEGQGSHWERQIGRRRSHQREVKLHARAKMEIIEQANALMDNSRADPTWAGYSTACKQLIEFDRAGAPWGGTRVADRIVFFLVNAMSRKPGPRVRRAISVQSAYQYLKKLRYMFARSPLANRRGGTLLEDLSRALVRGGALEPLNPAIPISVDQLRQVMRVTRNLTERMQVTMMWMVAGRNVDVNTLTKAEHKNPELLRVYVGVTKWAKAHQKPQMSEILARSL